MPGQGYHSLTVRSISVEHVAIPIFPYEPAKKCPQSKPKLHGDIPGYWQNRSGNRWSLLVFGVAVNCSIHSLQSQHLRDKGQAHKQ